MSLTKKQHLFVRERCLDFTVNMFYVVLFCLFEVLFGILALSFLANRPLLAADREDNPTRKYLSTKLEIKSKQLLELTEKRSQLKAIFVL